MHLSPPEPAKTNTLSRALNEVKGYGGRIMVVFIGQCSRATNLSCEMSDKTLGTFLTPKVFLD